MAELMDEIEEEEFMDYIVSGDLGRVGVERLEIVCASFFNVPLGNFKIKSDSLTVRTYGLFDFGGDFFYGKA